MFFEDMSYNSYDKAELKARRAFELYEEGNISQALWELQDAIDINPSNSAWHFNKGLALDAINRFDDAIKEYEAALELCPLDPEILNSLAVDYTRTGQYDLAINVFEHIQQIDPDFEPCYCNRIITYTEMGLHDLAEQIFYLAQQIEPDCAVCYYNIGNSLFVKGEYKKAIHCWLKTAELEPTHPQINYRIAQAYWSDGQNDKCCERFLAELRVNPGDMDVILDFGLFLLERGNIESAKEKFNRIIEFDPDFAVASFYLGEIAFNSNDYPLAIKLFNDALQKDSALPGPRYRLAQYELISGHKNKARSYLVSELELAPEDANILVSMGSMFIKIGELDYATHCLLKAISVDSTNADAYYYFGSINATKGRLSSAAELFNHALDVNPEHICTLRDSAIVYLIMGKLNKAAMRIKKAIVLSPDNSQLRWLGRKIRFIQATEQIAGFFRRFRR